MTYLGIFGVEPVAQLELVRHGGGQLGDELVVNLGVDEDPVGADAGLAGVAELGGHESPDGEVHVRGVEHDERSVPSELQGHFLYVSSALGVEYASYFGGACVRHNKIEIIYYKNKTISLKLNVKINLNKLNNCTP